MNLIKEAIFNLRFKLKRIPKISDFADHGSIGCYWEFSVNLSPSSSLDKG